jgi:hypothetical protein
MTWPFMSLVMVTVRGRPSAMPIPVSEPNPL